MAERATLHLAKGEDYIRTLTREVAGVAVDLTGYSARLQVRADIDSSVLIDLSTDTGNLLVASDGSVSMHVTPADVADIAVPDGSRLAYQSFGVFTLVLIDPDGVSECAWSGPAAIAPLPMRAVDGPAEQVTINLDQGESYEDSFVFAFQGVPVDLTGWTARLQVRAAPASDVVLLEASTDLETITLDSAGNIGVRFRAADIALLDVPDPTRLAYQSIAVYALVLTRTSTGASICARYGAVALAPAVTAVTDPDPTPTRPVARIVVTPATFTIAVGATQQLAFTMYDADDNALTGRVTTFESADESVATVDDSGLVTGVSGGECAIIVQCEGATTAAIATIVAEAPVASVEVTPSSFTIGLTGTRQLAAVAKDASGNVLSGKSFAYDSIGESVATVSSSGLVSAVAGGASAIVVTCDGVSGGAAVTVDPLADYIAWDDFNRADNVSLGSAPKGGTYKYSNNGADQFTPTCGVTSHKAAMSASGVHSCAWLDVGTGEVTANIGVGVFAGMFFRMQDVSNLWSAAYSGTTNVRLSFVTAGVTTTAANATVAAAGTVTVDARGTTIKVYVNGTLVITYSSSFLQTATRVGITGAFSEHDVFTNFWVKP